MKTIAFIFPDLLPMPDVMGGATETLIQKLIDDNERYQSFHFIIACKYDAEAEKKSQAYQCTSFVYIDCDKKTIYEKLRFLLFRVKRKISRQYVPEPYLIDLAKRIKSDHVDTVIVESAYRYVPYLRKSLKKPVYLHLHFDAVANGGQLLHKAIDKSAGIICVSRFLQQRVSAFDPAAHTMLLENTVDTELFDRAKYIAESALLRKQYGIGEKETVVMYSGRLIEAKGVYELIGAFIRALEKKPAMKLLLAGSAEYGDTVLDEYYEKLCSACGDLIGKNIFFTGYVPHEQMPVYFVAANIVVLPTTTVEEAAPLSVLEALSTECCFIGSDSGAIPEMAEYEYQNIVHRGNNFIYDLSDAILNAAESDDMRTIGNAGRWYILTKHDSRDYYRNFSQIFDIEI